jgi:hypothetical protein
VIVNFASPSEKKKPIDELLDKLAKDYDEKLKEGL